MATPKSEVVSMSVEERRQDFRDGARVGSKAFVAGMFKAAPEEKSDG